jgi:NAD+ synthase (glutamine-hydrolysing)
VSANKTDLALGEFVPVAGALAPIGDLFSRDLACLTMHLNAAGERIPRSVINHWQTGQPSGMPPSQASLPPDGRLDEILSRHIERGQNAEEIAAEGLDRQLVDQTLRQSDCAEQWRRQTPTVLQVSQRAFGLGRRVPVARHYP